LPRLAIEPRQATPPLPPRLSRARVRERPFSARAKGAPCHVRHTHESRAPFWLSGRKWRLDRTNSKFEFQVRHFWGLITASGRFQRFDASIETTDDGTAQIIVVIDAASLDTGNAKRDRHLRSDDFLDAATIPSSTSHQRHPRGQERINISGELEAPTSASHSPSTEACRSSPMATWRWRQEPSSTTASLA
jgi:YceI-like protein